MDSRSVVVCQPWLGCSWVRSWAPSPEPLPRGFFLARCLARQPPVRPLRAIFSPSPRHCRSRTSGIRADDRGRKPTRRSSEPPSSDDRNKLARSFEKRVRRCGVRIVDMTPGDRRLLRSSVRVLDTRVYAMLCLETLFSSIFGFERNSEEFQFQFRDYNRCFWLKDSLGL